jgi:hypothetical protein
MVIFRYSYVNDGAWTWYLAAMKTFTAAGLAVYRRAELLSPYPAWTVVKDHEALDGADREVVATRFGDWVSSNTEVRLEDDVGGGAKVVINIFSHDIACASTSTKRRRLHWMRRRICQVLISWCLNPGRKGRMMSWRMAGEGGGCVSILVRLRGFYDDVAAELDWDLIYKRLPRMYLGRRSRGTC